MAVRRVAGGSGKTRKTLQMWRRSDKRQRKGYVKTESDSFQCYSIYERGLLFGRFPDFARLSF